MKLRHLFIYISVLVLSVGYGCSQKEKVKSVRFGICSDAHLPTMHDSEKRITAFIDSMKTAKPDFIIELGDFAIPTKEYAPYFKIWNSFPGPKYHVIGNHEMDGGTTLDQAVAYRCMANSYYTFSEKGFKFIVLDGNDKEYEGQKGYRSYIGKKQLEWLRNELTNAGQPIVIFSHQPVGPDPGIPGERYSVGNAKDIRQMFEEHNKTHKNSLIICWVLGLDLQNVFNLRQDFGALNIIEFFEDGMSLRVLNNTCGVFPF